MDLLEAFKKVGSWTSTSPVDLVDRLSYQFSAAVLGVLVTLITLKQYAFKPIDCIPADAVNPSTPGWSDYINNMCWIGNLFYIREADGSDVKTNPFRERIRKQTSLDGHFLHPLLTRGHMLPFSHHLFICLLLFLCPLSAYLTNATKST